MKLPELNLQVKGFAVLCNHLGDSAYWVHNENFVVIFNPSALGEEIVVIGENSQPNEHYSTKDIIDALAAIREADERPISWGQTERSKGNAMD